MNKVEVLNRIREIGIVPVIRTDSAETALQAVEAVKAGGINVFEITMTVPRAVEITERLSDEFGAAVLIGAGTVLDAETAKTCIAAGAKFIVSPITDAATIELCRRDGVAVMPGALTPTEILKAWNAGADAVKIFPANALGGASYLRSVKAVLPQIELLPTGGINLETAADFIRAGAIAVGVGGELVDTEALRKGELSTITNLAGRFFEKIKICRTK